MSITDLPQVDTTSDYWVRTGDDDAPLWLVRHSPAGVHIWNATTATWVPTGPSSIPAQDSSDYDRVRPADLGRLMAYLADQPTRGDGPGGD